MLVSVIIPCFNAENYISNCLKSVLAQTYTPIEIICVDNNSVDNTFKILKQFEADFSNKIKVLQELKKGAPAARNKGLHEAKGEWIQFLDADDELMPDKILNQVAYIQSTKGVEVLISPLLKNLASGKQLYIEVVDNIWEGLIISRAGCTCSNLYKKSGLLNIGGWDETRKSSQEAWLLFNLLKSHAKIEIFNKAETVVNEQITGSISHTGRDENWERYILFRQEIWSYLQNKSLLTELLETKIKQTIFDAIRILYKENPGKAKQMYSTLVRKKFKPIVSIVTPSIYLKFYNLFGFSLTQKIFSLS